MTRKKILAELFSLTGHTEGEYAQFPDEELPPLLEATRRRIAHAQKEKAEFERRKKEKGFTNAVLSYFDPNVK